MARISLAATVLTASCGLFACGSGSGGGGASGQTSYVIGPQTCGTRSFTSITIYRAEETNYCTFLHDNTSNACPPNAGEIALQIVIGRSAYAPVDAIGPGTYSTDSETDNVEVLRLVGDGTEECGVHAGVGTGTVTLTHVGEDGMQGLYDVVIDGAAVTGSIDAPLCWGGDVTCPEE
jgi:hypothetical protein